MSASPFASASASPSSSSPSNPLTGDSPRAPDTAVTTADISAVAVSATEGRTVTPPLPQVIIRGHSSQSNIRIAAPSSTPFRFSQSSLRSTQHSHSDIDPVLRAELHPAHSDVPLDTFLDAFLPLDPAHPPPAFPPSYCAHDGGWTTHPGDYLKTLYGPFLETLCREIVDALPPHVRAPGRSFHYYRSKAPFVGVVNTGARRPDFYLSSNSDDSATPRWEHILAVGELSKPPKTELFVLVQLGGYARAVFMAQPGRRYVPAFYLHHDDMTLFHFDRGGAVQSTRFNVTNDPEHFLHAIAAYATLPDHRLGCDDTAWREGTESPSLRRVTVRSEEFVFQKVLYVRGSIVGRATACWTVKDADSNTFVIKDSWRDSGQFPESVMYERAIRTGVPGIAVLHTGVDLECEGAPDDILTIRRRLYDHDAEQNPKKRKLPTLDTNRVHTRLVLRSAVGTPIDPHSTPFTATEFFEAMRDAMICHRDLFTIGGILHRDISPDNILLTSAETKLTGDVRRKAFLIDFDYSITMENPTSGANFITGKLAYLSLSVAQMLPNTVRSDLESFFYVMCIICTTPANPTRTEHPLKGWHGTNLPQCVSVKRWGLSSKKPFAEYVLKHLAPAFEEAKDLLEDLRLLVTELDSWDPAGRMLDSLLEAMDTPGSQGHDARLQYMHDENKRGLVLGEQMMAQIDKWLVR